jgi:hypothetical protein
MAGWNPWTRKSEIGESATLRRSGLLASNASDVRSSLAIAAAVIVLGKKNGIRLRYLLARNNLR